MNFTAVITSDLDNKPQLLFPELKTAPIPSKVGRKLNWLSLNDNIPLSKYLLFVVGTMSNRVNEKQWCDKIMSKTSKQGIELCLYPEFCESR